MAEASVALGAPGCGPHGAGTRARDRRPSASTRETMCGPRERPVMAAEPLRGPPVGLQLRARLQDEERRPEMPQVSGLGE